MEGKEKAVSDLYGSGRGQKDFVDDGGKVAILLACGPDERRLAPEAI